MYANIKHIFEEAAPSILPFFQKQMHAGII